MPGAASVSSPDAPTKFSVRLPEGNYRVTVRFEARRATTRTHAFCAEQRRLMLEEVLARRQIVERSFIVNVRTRRSRRRCPRMPPVEHASR